MAVDPRKRQKTLARKAAKRKAKNARRAGGRARLPADSPLRVPAPQVPRARRALRAGHRYRTGQPKTSRRRHRLRRLLVDPWCLGVKNALLRVSSEARYGDFVEHLLIEESLEKVEPAYAKKLILDAVAYARALGFPPHPGYREAARSLEGIDAAACREVFSFGHEGKPFFTSGPNETPARCRQILETLRERVGPEGFHFIVHAQRPAEFRTMGFGDEDIEAKWHAVLDLSGKDDTSSVDFGPDDVPS